MSALVPYLPWISIVVALIAIFARDGIVKPPGESTNSRPRLLTILLASVGVAALAVLGWKLPSYQSGALPALAGVSIGVLLAIVCARLGEMPAQFLAGRTAPIALAAVAASFCGTFGDGPSLAMVFGAAVASWLLDLGDSDDEGKESQHWALAGAISAGCIVGCDILAEKAVALSGSSPISLGIILALAATVAGIIGGALGNVASRNKEGSWVSAGLSLALLAGGGFLIGQREGVQSAAPIFIVSLVVAAIVAWVVQEGVGSSTVRVMLGAIIWIAVATASFGYFQGTGMAIALMAGATGMLLLRNRRALLSLGPLAALVIYRSFRQTHTDTAEAFDIGQHYALIGVLLGVLLPLVAHEWLKVNAAASGAKVRCAGALWILLMAAAPVPIAIALSVKGIVGYLIGLGIAPALEGARGEKSAQSLSLALGLGAAMTLLYDWLEPHLDMERHDKIVALAWILGIMAVAAIAIAALSGERMKAAKAVDPA